MEKVLDVEKPIPRGLENHLLKDSRCLDKIWKFFVMINKISEYNIFSPNETVKIL